MAEPNPNLSLGAESDRVDRRTDDPLLKVEANLIEEIQALEEAWDRAIDKGYGNPVQIGESLKEKREQLQSLKFFQSFKVP